MTFLDLASDSAIKNGEIGAGEILESNRADFYMREANRMLDQWNIQTDFIWSELILTFNLTARTLPQYWFTIGPSGGTVAPDFISAMPTKIDRANLILTTSTPNARVPFNVLDYRQWSDETVPALGAAVPTDLYYDYGNYPNGLSGTIPVSLSNLYIWPYPTTTQNKVEIFTSNGMSRFATLADTFNFPYGYEDAFMLTLAERAIEGIKAIPATLAASAARARAAIRSFNSAAVKISTTDSGMPGGNRRARGSYYDGWQTRR